MIKKSSSFDAQSSKNNSPTDKKQLVKVGARVSERVSIGAALSKFASSIRNGIDACIPVVVRSYDRKTHTAVVAPLVKDVDQSAAIPIQTNPSEFKTSVLRLSCGTFLVDIPLNIGDTGWVIASDKDSTIVKSAVTIGSSDQPKPQSPGTLATHKHAFGFFIPDAWGEFPIKNEAGLVLSHIDPKTKRILSEIALNPNNVYINSKKVDVNSEIECTGKILSLVDVLAENISLKNHSHEVIINDESVISSKSLPEQEQTKVEIEGGGGCECEIVTPSADSKTGQAADAKGVWDLLKKLVDDFNDALQSIIDFVNNELQNMVDWMNEQFEKIWDAISGLEDEVGAISDLERRVAALEFWLAPGMNPAWDDADNIQAWLNDRLQKLVTGILGGGDYVGYSVVREVKKYTDPTTEKEQLLVNKAPIISWIQNGVLYIGWGTETITFIDGIGAGGNFPSDIYIPTGNMRRVGYTFVMQGRYLNSNGTLGIETDMPNSVAFEIIPYTNLNP